MIWFKNLRLFYKISVIVALAMVVFVVNIIYNTVGMLSSQKDLVLLEKKIYQIVQLATVNEVLIKRSDELFIQAVSFDDGDLKANAVEVLALLKNNISELKGLDVEYIDLLEDLETSIRRYEEVSIDIVDSMLNGSADFSTLGTIAAKKKSLFDKANEGLDSYKSRVDDFFRSTISQARARGEDTLRFSIVFGVGMMSVVLLVAVSVARSISRTANELRDSLGELAKGNGNLRNRIAVASEDELGKVAFNFNSFMDALMSIIQRVVSVSKPLSETSSRLLRTSTSARDLMQQQALDAQHAGQAMEEFRVAIQDVAESAAEARSEVNDSEQAIQNSLIIVKKTIENSVVFGQQLNQAAQSVRDLAEDTNSVNSILDVIKSIAEQTNLLALNAAIEAARAGEQGRGFAVVADEVRSLASRTGEATTEIFAVLENLRLNADKSVSLMSLSQEKSSLNEQYTQDTGDSLEQIRNRIDSITGINDKVATSTEQQSHVIEGLLNTINTMNQSVSHCADSFTELDNIAQELHDASEALTQATSQFNL